MILGLIPARGGSKGVPGKNVKEIAGKPLIAYAIECGLQALSIDHVVVSTDSEDIANVSREWGAEVPFMRPAELASDTAAMLPVMQHAITEAESHYGEQVDFLVLIDPTAPLRTSEDLDKSVTLVQQNDCDAVISGNQAHRSPYFNMVKQENGYVQLVIPSDVTRRQDAPEVFDLNTVVWTYSRKALMEEQARIPQKTKFYEVPVSRAIDIDTEEDWKRLEHEFSTIQRHQTA